MNYLLEEVMQERDRLRREREAAVAMLRIECAEYDDNDWPDSLHLADIIEKHLARSARKLELQARNEARRLADVLQRIADSIHGSQPPEGLCAHQSYVWAVEALEEYRAKQ